MTKLFQEPDTQMHHGGEGTASIEIFSSQPGAALTVSIPKLHFEVFRSSRLSALNIRTN